MSRGTIINGTEVAISRPPQVRQRLLSWRVGGGLFLVYLVLGLLFWRALLGHFGTHTLGGAGGDAGLFISWLQWDAYSVTHGLNPLHNGYLQAPYGMSAVWNTSVLALGIPLTPITYLFGAPASFNLIMVASPILSALAASKWLRRHVDTIPAFLGGLIYGFSPFVIGQSAGHAHLTFLALIPLIVICLENVFWYSERPLWPSAPLLGLLVALQYFISSEILLMLAISMVPAVIVLVAFRWRETKLRAKQVTVAAGVAIGVAVVLLAYPLLDQFSDAYRMDKPVQTASDFIGKKSYLWEATSALAFHGNPPADRAVENGMYVGWPLGIALLITVIVLRRRMYVWLAVIVAGFAVVCEVDLHIGGVEVSPLTHLQRLVPLTASVLPMRFASVFFLAAAFLFALGVAELMRVGVTRRWVGAVGAVLVLVTLASLLPGKTRATPAVFKTPEFFTSDVMKQTIPEGSTVMIAPMASSVNVVAEYWQVKANFWFKQLGGYGLNNQGTGIPTFVPRQRTLLQLFGSDRTGKTFTPQRLQDLVRNGRTELANSGATFFILGPSKLDVDAQLALAVQLLGRGPDLTTAGVQIWRLSEKCGTDVAVGPLCPALVK